MFSNLISLLLFISCSWAFAQEQESLKTLAQHPQWLKLLHYNHPFLRSRKSDVTSKDYFLSETGRTDPLAELLATIEGLKSNQDVYCRFPSRRIWLEKQGQVFEKRECPKFYEWTRGNSVKSISLIFATGFLGNPASFFGHPLLKFNFKDERSPQDLLDTAINYGAFTPPDVGALPYAVKGLLGGYDAGFSGSDFFYHRSNYSEMELRDLWEYELKLSPDQVEMIVAHLWDLKTAKLDYYFLDDNCAYRMGELLELVSEKEFVSKNLPHAIPASLFHRLYDYELFTDIKLHTSRQTRLTEKVYSLNSQEKKQLDVIVEDLDKTDSKDFLALSEGERSRVLETALDYFSYRQSLDNKTDFKPYKRKILSKRVALPAGQSEWKKIPQQPPHLTQKPQLTQIGFFYSEKFKESGNLRIRPAFYDLVSPDTARPRLSSLSIGDADFNFNDERLWLKNLNLISVESLNISRTGLYADGGYAWRLRAGADQMNLACNTCLVPKIEAGAGKAWEFSDWLVVYGMLDPRIQSNFKGSGFFALTPNVGTLITFSENFRLYGTAGRRYYISSDEKDQSLYSLEGRYGTSRTWDLRVSYLEHVDRRYGVALGVYW